MKYTIYPCLQKQLLTGVFLFLSILVSLGQIDSTTIDSTKKNLSLGFGGGGISYRGDLKSSVNSWGPALSISLTGSKKKRLNGQLEASISSFSAQQESSGFGVLTDSVNTFVKTSLISFSYKLAFNIVSTDRFRLFVGAGVGLLRFQPNDVDGNDLIAQSKTRAVDESFSSTIIQLPVHTGIRYFLKNGTSFMLQGILWNPQTDYLDNISTYGSRSGNDKITSIQGSVLFPIR